MKSIFIEELTPYTSVFIKNQLKINDSTLNDIIDFLKKFNVLKIVKHNKYNKNDDYLSSDLGTVDVLDDRNNYFVFTYVGVFIYKNYIFYCFPKYTNGNYEISDLKLIIQVLQKYNRTEQSFNIVEINDSVNNVNPLALHLHILDDYILHGKYVNYKEKYEFNGSGEINWNKTINNTTMFLSNNKPYYPNYITKKRYFDENNYFKKLHETIITIITFELKNLNLLELFSIDQIILSDLSLSDFGSKEFILYKIRLELSNQFNTRNRHILELMYAFISNNYSDNRESKFSFFGTNSFHVIWEKVCSTVLKNEINLKIKDLNIEINIPDNELTLNDLIESPRWKINNTFLKAEGKLVPDIIITENLDKLNYFIIADAKYYKPKISNTTILHQPGVGDVTKQFLYELSFKGFLTEDVRVINCFLLPTLDKNINNVGTVELNVFKNLNLSDVQIYYLPVKRMYNLYINDILLDRQDIFKL
ncbi:LlaJI family restriction endonuclease [Globicatella sulfidifaciens]|uniref:LlaJI family restriction endonuclease n=1 Tax=Globicatella sulfidifaciens TaxID=136093 RepID=UPI00288E9953|nr:LlaJI family restriction endonuclease [Globicatella sulfidifaciens]MDT2768037.1 LlaJI family restriction endonuclease [Globicatella sulfidifaciens]